jgi:hypothetical protein
MLAQTPSLHSAAVTATMGGGNKAGQEELGAETVDLFNCSAISSMIEGSMSWWTLLGRFVPQASRKSTYIFCSGVSIQPYSPERHRHYQEIESDGFGQVKVAEAQRDTALYHLDQINDEIETMALSRADWEERHSELDLEGQRLDEGENFLHELDSVARLALVDSREMYNAAETALVGMNLFPSPNPTQATIPTFLPTQPWDDFGSKGTDLTVEDGPNSEDRFIVSQLQTHLDDFFQKALGEYAGHASARNFQDFFSLALADSTFSWSIMKGEGQTAPSSSQPGSNLGHSSSLTGSQASVGGNISLPAEGSSNSCLPPYRSHAASSQAPHPRPMKRQLSGGDGDEPMVKRPRGSQQAGPSGARQPVVTVGSRPESPDGVPGSGAFRDHDHTPRQHDPSSSAVSSMRARRVIDVLGSTNYYIGGGDGRSTPSQGSVSASEEDESSQPETSEEI